METGNMNSKARLKVSSEKIVRKSSDSVAHYMGQLGIALGQAVTAERIGLYCRALSDLTDYQIAQGFEKALKFFKPEFGKAFPAPAEIREYALQFQQEHTSRVLLERGDKPPGWEPVSPEELRAFVEEVKRVARSKKL